MKRKFNKKRTQKVEGWQAFADQFGGELVLRTKRSEHDRMGLRHRNWTLVLDTVIRSLGKTAATFTRLRAHYYNADSFQFKVLPAHALSFIDKKFGMQDVEVGYRAFDKRFIIQGNSDQKLQSLFASEQLRHHMLEVPQKYKLETRTDHDWFLRDFRDGESELAFEMMWTPTEPELLAHIYQMMTTTLDQLQTLGSAHEDAPTWRWKEN
jgi:hypothetical protein